MCARVCVCVWFRRYVEQCALMMLLLAHRYAGMIASTIKMAA